MLESETELAAAAAAAAAGALRALELGGSSSGTPSSSTGDLKSTTKSSPDGTREKTSGNGTSAGHYKTLRRTRKYVVDGETRMTTSERIILQGEEGRFHEEFDARYGTSCTD